MRPALAILIFLTASIDASPPECRIAPPHIIISETYTPLADYVLELIFSYGKQTASTTAALDALRYAGLTSLSDETEVSGQIQIHVRRKNNGNSATGILLDSALSRARRLEVELKCVKDALERRKQSGEEWAGMKKVVDVVLEELEGDRVRLEEGRRVWSMSVGVRGMREKVV